MYQTKTLEMSKTKKEPNGYGEARGMTRIVPDKTIGSGNSTITVQDSEYYRLK